MGDAQYPLVPPELLQYTLLHETSLSDRTDVGSTSLLRFLSKPGHYQGEGYRRIYIGVHPDDDYNTVLEHSAAAASPDFAQSGGHGDDDGSRSFLIGVQTLWELEKRERDRLRKGKGRERSPSRAVQPLSRHSLPNGHVTHEQQNDKPPDRHSRFATTGTATDTISGDSGASSSSSNDDDNDPPDIEDHSSSPPTSVSKHRFLGLRTRFGKNKAASSTSKHATKSKVKRSSLRNESSADKLLEQFNSKDARKKLSSGVSSVSVGRRPPLEDGEDENTPRPQDVLSRRALDSPRALDGASSTAIFYDANSFVDHDGKRTTGREVSNEVKAKVRESMAPEVEPESEARHELLRRVSDTLVPETASDTFVLSHGTKTGASFNSGAADQTRPTAERFKSTKSVRWDVSNGQSLVPGSKGKSQSAFAPGSGDQPATDPSQVLSRPEPLEQPAEQVPDNIPPLAQLSRSETSDSGRELARLAELKEASLPPGSEKLERMIIRVCWTKKQNYSGDFDELVARKSKLDWQPWEEMAVLWRRNRLEIYGTHRDPYHRFMTRQLALRYVIPLKPGRKTQLSVYSVADQIFCLHCPPYPIGGRHLSGKAGMRSKRHVNEEGTNVFLFRARAPSIAQDWYLGLHLALQKTRLENLEVYLSGLGLRIRLPTNAAAHDTAASNAAASATRSLMHAGLPDRNLVSKEEMLQSCKDLISNRQDWKELLESIERRGVTLKMAWRKGLTLEWLTIDRSVDGVKRIWDVYAGAIMKQASEPINRLEVLPETHYPNLVRISTGVHLIEPPAIEGHISRLRHRNENQRERLYLGTFGGMLLIFKASRAKLPSFPSAEHLYGAANGGEDNEAFDEIRSSTAKASQPRKLQDQFKAENARLKEMLIRCKGLIRMRDIVSVELDDSCQHCRDGKLSKKEMKSEAQGKTGNHEHIVVQLNLGDNRQFRFETMPKEAAREWVGRLSSLVDYWTKREQGDAQMQLSLSSYSCVKKSSETPLEDMPPFQQREREDASTGTDVYEPLLSQAFNYCVQDGCKNNILMQGRLYLKQGHRDAIFLDRFIVLLDNDLVIYESYRRNIQKRPIPLVYHRRLKTIRLRDAYIVTGESCAQYFRMTGQSDFNPSQDQNARARIYKDGLVAVDDPMDCTFMIWRQRPSGTVSKLGRNGKAHLFRARSKLERDQWVQAFNVMCEAYGRTTREREVRLATFSQIK